MLSSKFWGEGVSGVENVFLAIPAFHKGQDWAFLLFGLGHLERKLSREESGAVAGTFGKEMQRKVFGIHVFSHGPPITL